MALAKLQDVLWQTEVQVLLLTLHVLCLLAWTTVLKSVLLAFFPADVSAFRDSSYLLGSVKTSGFLPTAGTLMCPSS